MSRLQLTCQPKLIAEIRRRVREFWASIDAGDEPPVDFGYLDGRCMRSDDTEVAGYVYGTNREGRECATRLRKRLASTRWIG